MLHYGTCTQNFDENWRFHLGIPQCGPSIYLLRKAGYVFTDMADARFYNDSAWEKVNLPHDWGMELDYDYSGGRHDGALPIQTGKKINPLGYYRKTFFVPSEWAEKQIYINFEGVFRNCDVCINGQYVTHNTSGYIGFYCDITDLLYYGEENSISVKVDASSVEGWFYEGAGIYRHVWLHILPKLHVDPRNVFIHSDIDGEGATVIAEFTVINSSETELSSPIGLSIAGDSVTEDICVPANSEVRLCRKVHLDNFIPWDLDNPHLYTVRVGNLDDKDGVYTTRFGIRSLYFDKDKGFFLNGKSVKILGSSTHQDFTGVGVALNDDMQKYKVKVLKEYGFNAIRTAHNQPSPALLDACDELGCLVMNELRQFGSTPECMDQYERSILRDRNHPSVFIWSIGNEELALQNTEVGVRQAKTVLRLFHKLDPTRQVTYAANNGGNITGVSKLMDIRGVNYMLMGGSASTIDEYHATYPDQPVIGTEDSSCFATRGIYKDDPQNGYIQSFDNTGAGPTLLGAEALWKEIAKRDYYSGTFVWTGFDYRGEATHTAYITNFGVIDHCGYPKSPAYYYKSATAKEPVLYLYPHLNFIPETGEKTLVRCYTNLDEVEFFADGKSAGRFSRKPYDRIDLYLDEHPETVEAVGYRDGKEAARYKVKKAYEPKKLVVTSEIIGNTAFVHIEASDEYGTLNPTASNRLHFESKGCRILGVGNGNPSDGDKEYLLPQVVRHPLYGFRVYEPDTARRYSDQALEGIVGSMEFEPALYVYRDYAEETEEQRAMHDGPVRRLRIPPKTVSASEYKINLNCDFWMDAADMDYTYLHIGFVAGIAKITLNGHEIYNQNATSDAVQIPLSDMLLQGENNLQIALKPNPAGTYGIGKGMSLIKYEEPHYTRRLFSGKALCMVDISNGGELTVSSDNMEDVTVKF